MPGRRRCDLRAQGRARVLVCDRAEVERRAGGAARCGAAATTSCATAGPVAQRRARTMVVMDEPSVLRAVLDRPDDDGPRLVYADWLLERGDPRGEYIA